MSLFAHIEELNEKHRAIHREIELEMARPLFVHSESLALKRRKLRLR